MHNELLLPIRLTKRGKKVMRDNENDSFPR